MRRAAEVDTTRKKHTNRQTFAVKRVRLKSDLVDLSLSS